MKSILNKIYFHPLFIIVSFIFILMGRFRFLLYFMLLILVHELGHILMSNYYKWNIDKIIILPFGGLTKYNTNINIPIKEEFMVSIMGIIIQFIFYLLTNRAIEYKYYSIINYFIIIFNFIPIYPLDGSKILNVISNKITSYFKSINITVIISIISIILLSLFSINKNRLIIIVELFLSIEVYKLYKSRNLLLNKFLLERYLNIFKFKNKKIVKNIYEMKKDYTHLFLINKECIKESLYLKKMFDK